MAFVLLFQVVIGKLRSDTSTADSHHLQHLKAAKALLVTSFHSQIKWLFYLIFIKTSCLHFLLYHLVFSFASNDDIKIKFKIFANCKTYSLMHKFICICHFLNGNLPSIKIGTARKRIIISISERATRLNGRISSFHFIVKSDKGSSWVHCDISAVSFRRQCDQIW